MYFLCFRARDIVVMQLVTKFRAYKRKCFRVDSIFFFVAWYFSLMQLHEQVFSSIEYRRWIFICSWRSGERKRWIKQDLPTTRALVICAECDLLVEVSHISCIFLWENKVGSRVTYRDICCLEVHFVFVTFACLLSYKLGMAERQRGGERDIDIESRRELNAVADNSAVSERIVALKKSKAGHLGD